MNRRGVWRHFSPAEQGWGSFENRSGLLWLEARIVADDALCFTQNAVRLRISLAAPPDERITLSLGG